MSGYTQTPQMHSLKRKHDSTLGPSDNSKRPFQNPANLPSSSRVLQESTQPSSFGCNPQGSAFGTAQHYDPVRDQICTLNSPFPDLPAPEMSSLPLPPTVNMQPSADRLPAHNAGLPSSASRSRPISPPAREHFDVLKDRYTPSAEQVKNLEAIQFLCTQKYLEEQVFKAYREGDQDQLRRITRLLFSNYVGSGDYKDSGRFVSATYPDGTWRFEIHSEFGHWVFQTLPIGDDLRP